MASTTATTAEPAKPTLVAVEHDDRGGAHRHDERDHLVAQDERLLFRQQLVAVQQREVLKRTTEEEVGEDEYDGGRQRVDARAGDCW